ncbi:aspartate carbamoyltransferase catalytic subunit [Facklamia sp. 7083-14-GEN3]|uniref:aspartate carbamoyltransferase catalytic subunit n=1 Tax=Facklamia sp. 7083-14-GEN3 TaxID=2973478 RepID=UPI00215C9709|nr:aspartate carbamoyltransferase catalytic subunit [Facklamia sp. 7083-14-GEN3]MCR8969344.1 aspartate carbamoyltransferase catalytic subunit [Facklamia sp. 7083-14-GEN3]
MSNHNLVFKHFESTKKLNSGMVMKLIHRAIEFKNLDRSLLPQYPGHFVCNVFLENSTRTHLSFEMAEKKLGMPVIAFDAKTSSLSKGETLLDTLITLESLGVDTVVVRTREENYFEPLMKSPHLNLSIINGGDGASQHPTQCMLDLMTIYEKFQRFIGLKIAIVGDLSHSRVAHSNAEILSRLGAELFFSGPEEWYDETFDHFGSYLPMDELIGEVDVLMLLRVQLERHDQPDSFEAETYHRLYGLNIERASRMQDHAIIMHPAPVNRGVEIADELVMSEKSVIAEQMKNGVFMRMSIIEAVMNGK